jgi:hypothetical protein
MKAIAREPLDIALVTQMRAGTHYFCGALRVALEAIVLRPSAGEYVTMDDEYIKRGLYSDSRIELPAPTANRRVFFSHYYHPQWKRLEMPRIHLIGFPLDSFYSDGIVAAAENYDPSPSGPRASSYVLRYGSPEWNLLSDRMRENANWLRDIQDDAAALVVRYEDLFVAFESTVARISEFLRGIQNPFPKPIKNPRRMYWTRDYLSCLDEEALRELRLIFADAIDYYYPETSIR